MNGAQVVGLFIEKACTRHKFGVLMFYFMCKKLVLNDVVRILVLVTCRFRNLLNLMQKLITTAAVV